MPDSHLNATRPFFFLAPLSNWFLAYDRHARSRDKRGLSSAHFSHENCVLAGNDEVGFSVVLEKTRHLVCRLGVKGDRILRIGMELPIEGEVRAEPNTRPGRETAPCCRQSPWSENQMSETRFCAGVEERGDTRLVIGSLPS